MAYPQWFPILFGLVLFNSHAYQKQGKIVQLYGKVQRGDSLVVMRIYMVILLLVTGLTLNSTIVRRGPSSFLLL